MIVAPRAHAPLTQTLGLSAAGIGLRAAYYDDFLDTAPPVGWLEVHAENYFCPGSVQHQILLTIAERYPISLHGVGLSLGSADGLDGEHLDRLARLIHEAHPVLISEHLAWSRIDGVYYNDLLPLPLTEESLDVVVQNVDRAQDRIGCRMLIENPSAYLRFVESTMSEPEFLGRLIERSGCGLLLDINNVFVSAHNLRFDPAAYVAAVPAAAVGEIHLAGYEASRRAGSALLIDAHSCAVAGPVWELYDQTVALIGPRPTLIEWDTQLPPLDTLVAEARRAAASMGARSG